MLCSALPCKELFALRVVAASARADTNREIEDDPGKGCKVCGLEGGAMGCVGYTFVYVYGAHTYERPLLLSCRSQEQAEIKFRYMSKTTVKR